MVQHIDQFHRLNGYQIRYFNFSFKFFRKKFNLITDDIEIQNTKKEFTGDLTVVLFPFYKLIEKNQISSFAKDLGGNLVSKSEKIDSFNIVGGFESYCF